MQIQREQKLPTNKIRATSSHKRCAVTADLSPLALFQRQSGTNDTSRLNSISNQMTYSHYPGLHLSICITMNADDQVIMNWCLLELAIYKLQFAFPIFQHPTSCHKYCIIYEALCDISGYDRHDRHASQSLIRYLGNPHPSSV